MEYDPVGNGWISLHELIFFIYELPHPFSLLVQDVIAEDKRKKSEPRTS